MIRVMTIDDYEQVRSLWMQIKGFAIRSIDDSREGVWRFLERNPNTSVVAVEDKKVVGAILCGHDGRRGCLYHVCVNPQYRRRGIGKAMVVFCMDALKEEKRLLEQKIRNLDHELSKMQLTAGLAGGSADKEKARTRVNRLMREVDKCIALLNKPQ